ncbi:hypothetical protein RUM43_003426 [Polyplax serrata]|uniref:C2H2-type domain-containing protein n=1 Tax=Polyplax serrata TaxID=468196 RepID=A0AAN8NVE5_POLSC
MMDQMNSCRLKPPEYWRDISSIETQIMIDEFKEKLKGPCEKFTCSLCGEEFDELYRGEHLKNHETKISLPCENCDKVFVSALARQRHMYLLHGKELICRVCDKTFPEISKFRSHQEWVHGEKDYRCPLCGYITSVRSKLGLHVRTLHEQNYSFFCNICSKGFKAKFELEEHKNMHSGSTANQCEFCQKRFQLKTMLRAHKIRVHNKMLRRTCTICKERFATISLLESHTLYHKEKRPFSCNVCGKSFKTPVALDQHKKIHICDLCKKTFSKAKQLRKHMNTHNIAHTSQHKERRYECEFCKKKYADQDACILHMKTGHKVAYNKVAKTIEKKNLKYYCIQGRDSRYVKPVLYYPEHQF